MSNQCVFLYTFSSGTLTGRGFCVLAAIFEFTLFKREPTDPIYTVFYVTRRRGFDKRITIFWCDVS